MGEIAEVAERIRGMALAYWQLPPVKTVWEWAESEIRLINVPTPRPGGYSTTLTPYVREPLECWRDASVRECVLCWGSQTGKTTTLKVGQSWMIANDPGPALWVFPNENLAKTFSGGRWLPMLKDSPAMKAMLPSDPRKIKQLEQQFSTCLVLFAGSNSAANLSSNPVRVAVLDEVDKLAEQSAKEASAVELTEQRTKGYWPTRKVFLTSTPTLPEGPIWGRYLSGDQRRFFLPCIQCSGPVLPVLSKTASSLPVVGCEAECEFDSSAKADDGSYDWELVVSSTRLVCPHCGNRMHDNEKTRLLRAGEWRPTAQPTARWRRSYHLNSLYSPDIPWGELVAQFLQAKQSLDGLQGFVNGALAEPWQHQDERSERKEAIVDLQAPSGQVIARVLTADLQADPPSWFVVREYYAGGHSRLVEWGTWQSFEELDEHRARLMVAADLTGVDSGYEGPEVYRRCAQFGWFAMRGDDQASWPLPMKNSKPIRVPWTERRFDPYQGTTAAGRKRIIELRWSNPSIKDILATLRDATRSPVRWEVPEQYATEEYFRHLDGEYKARQYSPKTGKTSYVWRQRGRRWPNHLFDCECMQIAVAIRVGILKTSAEETNGQ